MLKKVLVGAVAMTAATMFAAPQAQAFGWGSWGSHGSHGSWGSHGSSGGSWGSHGSHGGLLKGLIGHIFHHSHGSHGSWGSHGSSGGSWGSHGSSGGSWGSHGSSGGSWGSHGSSGGSWGSHGSSGGSWGSHGSSGGMVMSSGSYMEGEAVEAAPADAENVPTPKADEGAINLHVPGDAKVFINGVATTSSGLRRNYISRGLEAGKQYTFEVRAEVIRDGETVSETKSVTLGGGKSANLDMQLEGNELVAGKGVKTALIIRVPADAKIILAGQPTSSTGEVREFATDRLADGAWTNYPIRAEITKNGRTIVEERQITLKSGETKEISIDFVEAELASR